MSSFILTIVHGKVRSSHHHHQNLFLFLNHLMITLYNLSTNLIWFYLSIFTAQTSSSSSLARSSHIHSNLQHNLLLHCNVSESSDQTRHSGILEELSTPKHNNSQHRRTRILFCISRKYSLYSHNSLNFNSNFEYILRPPHQSS